MAETQNRKEFDLEDRTLAFAQAIIQFLKVVPRSLTNVEIIKQLVRSAGSVGANYIEANEALGKKDFLLHIKISRKEAKESRYWLQLIDVAGEAQEHERKRLFGESTELMKIFGSIIVKSSAQAKR